MYAGGLSYFSSGSFRGTLYVGASWAEALASPDNKTRQIKKRVLDIIKHLQLKKATVYQNTHPASTKFFPTHNLNRDRHTSAGRGKSQFDLRFSRRRCASGN